MLRHRLLPLSIATFMVCGVMHGAPSVDAAKADNAFSFALMKHLATGEDNLIYSPLSLWTGLAMTSAGAEAETLREMRAALHLPEDDATANALAGDWAKELTGLKGVELNVANRLWGAKGLPFVEDYLKLTADRYKAGLETLDFKSSANGARMRINDWVAQETRDRIKDLLQPQNVTADTLLVLTNAVYFKAKWQHPFNGDNTRDWDFKLVSGKAVATKTMSQTLHVAYFENDRLQAVRLPYVGGQTSMIVVLPTKVDGLKGGAFLDAEGFAEVQQGLKPGVKTVVLLPRFEVSARMSLPEVLTKLGMKRAFTDRAQFGRMCHDPLKISEVIHQAWVKVGEEGTEAAAATAVSMVAGSARRVEEPPKVFQADHPFLFFIVDDRNGGVLFAGRVMDPR
ncbi:hypothetical protein AYO49_00290 [Verrucomicrobiaceae bacterium SCGC AG-212-N21]|nr:hypothetical protein AYO49_00290 [Verrucomicrobiaceae bacterium SCGC AG-212-N21]